MYLVRSPALDNEAARDAAMERAVRPSTPRSTVSTFMQHFKATTVMLRASMLQITDQSGIAEPSCKTRQRFVLTIEPGTPYPGSEE